MLGLCLTVHMRYLPLSWGSFCWIVFQPSRRKTALQPLQTKVCTFLFPGSWKCRWWECVCASGGDVADLSVLLWAPHGCFCSSIAGVCVGGCEHAPLWGFGVGFLCSFYQSSYWVLFWLRERSSLWLGPSSVLHLTF